MQSLTYTQQYWRNDITCRNTDSIIHSIGFSFWLSTCFDHFLQKHAVPLLQCMQGVDFSLQYFCIVGDAFVPAQQMLSQEKILRYEEGATYGLN